MQFLTLTAMLLQLANTQIPGKYPADVSLATQLQVKEPKPGTTKQIQVSSVNNRLVTLLVGSDFNEKTQRRDARGTNFRLQQPDRNFRQSILQGNFRQPRANNFRQPRTNSFRQPRTNNFRQPRTNNFRQPRTNNFRHPRTNNFRQPQRAKKFDRSSTLNRRQAANAGSYGAAGPTTNNGGTGNIAGNNNPGPNAPATSDNVDGDAASAAQVAPPDEPLPPPKPIDFNAPPDLRVPKPSYEEAPKCDPPQITCNNFEKCVEAKLVCNGELDCEDGTDEMHCDVTPPEVVCMKLGKFACADGTCLVPACKCNGMDECGDNSDELGC